MERNEYDVQAEAFLAKHRITLKAAFKGDRCPPWEDGQCVHGHRYRVTLRRVDRERKPQSLSFDFWNSQADTNAGRRPRAYDVLACISGDAYTPETFADFCGEFGYDEDSRRAYDTFKRVSAFAAKLRAFFVEDELQDLAEIH